jgi:site-specific recombinase XerD
VIQRIHRLKTLEVEINWGGQGSKKKLKVVRPANPSDLVFQNLRNREPMHDQNILKRHLQPAANKLGLDKKKATWHALRRSWATWMIRAGADPKSVQAQLRHSRISTTMEIYAQVVSEAQRQAVTRTMAMPEERVQQPEILN